MSCLPGTCVTCDEAREEQANLSHELELMLDRITVLEADNNALRATLSRQRLPSYADPQISVDRLREKLIVRRR